jgi:hypothetical protein
MMAFQIAHEHSIFPFTFFVHLVIPDIVSCFMHQAKLDHNLPIHASLMAGMENVWHHAQLLLAELGSHKLFAQSVLEP